jgi:plasmid maintenance system antidote protein VapI
MSVQDTLDLEEIPLTGEALRESSDEYNLDPSELAEAARRVQREYEDIIAECREVHEVAAETEDRIYLLDGTGHEWNEAQNAAELSEYERKALTHAHRMVTEERAPREGNKFGREELSRYFGYVTPLVIQKP